MAQPFPATREDWDIAGRTLFGEARGESWDGQIAVAWVIRNRAQQPSWWGQTISEVCKKPWQFSVWNDGDPNKALIEAVGPEVPAFRRALGIMALVLSGDLSDPTGQATSYHTATPPQSDMAWPPSWAMKMRQTARSGHHVFYREYAPNERLQE